jgi:hypothetical protein
MAKHYSFMQMIYNRHQGFTTFKTNSTPNTALPISVQMARNWYNARHPYFHLMPMNVEHTYCAALRGPSSCTSWKHVNTYHTSKFGTTRMLVDCRMPIFRHSGHFDIPSANRIRGIISLPSLKYCCSARQLGNSKLGYTHTNFPISIISKKNQ